MHRTRSLTKPVARIINNRQIHARNIHRAALSKICHGNVYRPSGRLVQSKGVYGYIAPVTMMPQRSYSSLPDHFPVPLPALSPTMESGTIVKWMKKEGEQINEGDLLAEIETDKATMGFETPEEGYLAKILIPAGAKDVPIGKLMCVIVPDEGDVAAFANFTGEDSSDAPASSSSSSGGDEGASSSAGDYPEYIEMPMPAQSPTMTHGDILSWEKKEGEKCNEGDVLLRVKTDKADIDVECPEEAYLAKILVSAGTEQVPLGQLLCVFTEEESDVPKFADFKAPSSAAAPEQPTEPKSTPKPSAPKPSPSRPAPSKPAAAAPARKSGERVFATPFARKLAAEKGYEISEIQGSGPDGQVRASDVENFTPQAAAPPAAPAATTAASPAATQPPPPGAFAEDILLSGMRKVIAKRLMESKSTIPHYYLSVDVTMDSVLKLRSELNTHLKGGETKLSVNDFVIKAASLACMRVPEANSSWQGDFIRKFNSVDMCVAVATDEGLITPIVTAAEKKGLAAINADVKRLAEKARQGTLHPSEFQGGTFTISNLGMYGIKNFSAIINPPQACILAVGGAEKRLVPDVDSEKGYRSETVMSVTLSCDHRVVDGAVGAQWLQHFKRFLEKPNTMLL